MTDWAAQVVLVTGGSRGIGAATVRALAGRGARVAFTYLGQGEAARALCDELDAEGGNVMSIQGDLAEGGFADRVLDAVAGRWSTPTCLVNNAGITGYYGSFADLPEPALRQTFEVNVLGTLRLAQQMVRRWGAAGIRGRMVNLSSIAATLGSPGEYVHYAASKAAIDAFTIGLAKELAPEGIRINAVAPGITLTDIHASTGMPDRPARMAGRIPVQRAARPEEIASAVLWLLSDEASYTTGSILRVSGGL